MIIKGISFKDDVFEFLEDARGRLNRSKYINNVLKEVASGQSPNMNAYNMTNPATKAGIDNE
jgi:hypothetical protein